MRGNSLTDKFETDLIVGFSVSLNNDLTVIERSGYTIVDLFSDIGGIQSFLSTAIGIFLSFWNHNYLDNYLVSQLFNISVENGESYNRSSQLNSTREFFMERVLPAKLVCCRKSEA